MPALIQVCIVVVTLAVVAIAIAVVRAMTRAREMVERLTRLTGEVRQWILDVDALTREARDTLESVHGVIAPIRRVADRFEAIGGRVADLSEGVLREIEPTLLTTVAVARGARSLTARLMKRWSHRSHSGRFATCGGSDHE